MSARPIGRSAPLLAFGRGPESLSPQTGGLVHRQLTGADLGKSAAPQDQTGFHPSAPIGPESRFFMRAIIIRILIRYPPDGLERFSAEGLGTDRALSQLASECESPLGAVGRAYSLCMSRRLQSLRRSGLTRCASSGLTGAGPS